jgi:hypothetical protein
MPPQVAPYHLRLDWLMWFAAMTDTASDLWFVHFVEKLLEGDPATLSLLRYNPFPDKPPRLIRAELYEYHFAKPEERRQSGRWWDRTYSNSYFPPVSLETPQFRQLLESQGWAVPAPRSKVSLIR